VIALGYRDDGGYLRQVERVKTRDLPKLGGGAWDPFKCLNFLNDFLKHIRSVLREAGENSVVRFRFEAGTKTISAEVAPNSPDLRQRIEKVLNKANEG